jgi:hypothetical protein
VTLDAGPLIAASRNERVFWVWWKLVTRAGVVVRVPAPVVAQAWRGRRDARLGQVLSGCSCVPLELTRARRTGELCARTGTDDIADAAVVVIAAEHGDDIVTTDPQDLETLAHRVGGPGRVVDLAMLR